MQQFKWEEIKQDHDFYLFRAKVFGGWLVLAEFDALIKTEHTGSPMYESGHQWRPAMTFVPDPKHEWGLND